MKLHRLELEGFGPFREPQVVDFDAFADDGLFLISGRTGAGKSSVLDGVCFALYGGAPRYEGAEKRLRSDHSAPEDATRVVLEFTSAGSRWRVTRSPEYDRPKKNGNGLTPEPHRAHLDEWVGGEWIGRAARPVDVANQLDEILGLNQQQFLQVILLAQNRFAQFLLAKNDDRQKLLRTLFGTRTYEEYARELESRRKASEQSIATGLDGVRLRLDDAERLVDEHDLGPVEPEGITEEAAPAELTGRLVSAARAVDRAAYRADVAAQTRDAADSRHRDVAAAHAALTARVAQLADRDRGRDTLAALELEAPAIADLRVRLDRAARAEGLRSAIDTATRAGALADTARAAQTRAVDAWVAAGEPAPHDGDLTPVELAALRARVERLGESLGEWSSAVTQERELPDQEEALAAARADADDLDALTTQIEAQRAGIPVALAGLDAQIAAQALAAGALASARDRLAAAELQVAAAEEAEVRGAEAAAADAIAVARGLSMQEASGAVTALLQRRLAGHAGELAAALVDGAECAVCGSTTHPHPAEPSDDPVTDDAVAAAETAKDAAIAAEQVASAAAREARTALAEATARAGGVDVPALVAALDRARAAHAAAADAQSAHERLVAERQALQESDAAAAAERDALAAQLAALRESIAAATATLESARATVAAARGEAESVSARVAETSRLRDLARALADAAAERADRAEAERDARADRDARVAASHFADVDDALAALLSPAARAEQEEQVREHDTALRTVKGKLLDLELALADAPDEPIDLAAADAELAAAREEWSAAEKAAAVAEQVQLRLQDLVRQARTAHDRFASLADEHSVLARLADTVAGRAPNTHRMTLESFVLAAELEEIVDAANLRLDDMSSGRYRLQHTDARAARNAASGLGLEIMDAYTGQPRPAQSLSGGETFLASLALALGLAEVVTARAGGVRLDTLFVDEGFGSLDAETLDQAMRTLDELRQGGRTVGVISHVEAMKEQIPAQLVVEATHTGPSVIRQAAFRLDE